ncbi:MAG: ExeM/NucH family extracellular endonuclease [Bacteroidota bacterium]
MRIRICMLGLSLLLACTTTPPDGSEEPINRSIMEIQGDANASPEVGNRVQTQGVVTALFAELGGYFISDTVGDDDPATSDGIFVANNSSAPAVGDYVQLTGTVREVSGRTQLANLTQTEVLASGLAVSPQEVNFPLDFEAHEGMYIAFVQPLQVIGNRGLSRFGEITLASSIQYTPSQVLDANDDPASGNTFSGNDQVAALESLSAANFSSRLVLDDGTDRSLDEGEDPVWGTFENPAIPGTEVSGIVGVLHYDFGRYALEPTVEPSFNLGSVPGLTEAPEMANLSVATYNLENFFNGDGSGSGFGERGPGNNAEYEVQLAKVTQTILGLGADIIGLQEVENDGDGESSSLSALLASVNTAAGELVYAAIYDVPGQVNSGSIRNAFLYRTDRVVPVGAPMADTDPIHLRVPITQRFQLLSNGAEVWVCNVHHRSKSCSNASGENQDGGQGCYNARRQEQMAAVWRWLDVEMVNSEVATAIVLGDYNSYSQEDPVDYMRAQGWQSALPDSSYTYVFQDQRGALDQMMVSPALSVGLLQAQPWHINADYPAGFKFSALGGNTDLFWRSSDHDPILAHFFVEPSMERPAVSNSPVPLDFSIYPNPTSRDARLVLNGVWERVTAYATDAQGKQIWQEDYEAVRSIKLPSHLWAPGLYHITIQAEQETQQLRFVKE